MAYLPTMYRLGTYDQICHEHATYWDLTTLDRVLNQAGLFITEVSMNGINGGSFAVNVMHATLRNCRLTQPSVSWLLDQENGPQSDWNFLDFAERVAQHRANMRGLMNLLKAQGKRVFGYGASTKGNTLLQYCGIGPDLITAIAEVNQDKFGKFTPGTGIPILSDPEVRKQDPDYFLVLPWHFREDIVAREQAFLANGGRLIFPFPAIEIV